MTNAGTALTYAEELLLERLAERSQTLGIRLLDREPTLREELGAGDGDGIDCALWLDDVDAELIVPSVANANTGRIVYDELIRITIRIQAMALVDADRTLADVKGRAALGLNEVIRVAATIPDLRTTSGHAMLILTLSGYNREAGKLAGGKGYVARYTVEANVRARITPDTPAA